jgi:hypothetical protein
VAYGVQFVDGEPDLPGWLATTARAESIIENPSVAWREHIRILRGHARFEKRTSRRAALRLEAAKARVAMLEGKPYPRARHLALVDFIVSLQWRTDLPHVALCFLAWWKELMLPNPASPSARQEVERLIKRRWAE